MVSKFLFTNILGSFVFNESFRVVDKVEFKTLEDFGNREEHENRLKEKHAALEKPEGVALDKILRSFNNKRDLNELQQKNLAITKNAIKDSVSNDNLIIQASNAVEDFDRTTNLLIKRLREWYSYYFPELTHKIEDHEKLVNLITDKNRDKLMKDLRVKESMGAELGERDVSYVAALAKQISNLYKLRKHYENYLKVLEKESCPNFATVAGPTIAAKLLTHAGSMKRLTEMPASTIQILGAEKALFRHMRNKRNKPPKYGILHEHQLIQKSGRKDHGKAARALADKISIAVRIDYFKGKYRGAEMKKELVEKFGIQY